MREMSASYWQGVTVFPKDINAAQTNQIMLECHGANDNTAILCTQWFRDMLRKQGRARQHDCDILKYLTFYTIYSRWIFTDIKIMLANSKNLAALYSMARDTINRVELIKINTMNRLKMYNRNSVLRLHVHFKRA